MSSPSDASEQPCALCGAPTEGGVHARSLKPALLAHLTEGRPLGEADRVCSRCLRAARIAYLESRLSVERGELSQLESEAAQKAADHLVIALDTNERADQSMSLGERVSDGVARVGGSWPFVISFSVFILIWAFVNAWLAKSAFDPYPFILLNLILSCVAALQAPIIMMSQNRANAHDRMRAEQDYRVNLKAELEVGTLHDKLDHLLHERWESMIEMQYEQLELLRELTERRNQTEPTRERSE